MFSSRNVSSEKVLTKNVKVTVLKFQGKKFRIKLAVNTFEDYFNSSTDIMAFLLTLEHALLNFDNNNDKKHEVMTIAITIMIKVCISLEIKRGHVI